MLHPAMPILVAVLALPLLPLGMRRIACLAAPLGSLLWVLQASDGTALGLDFLGQSLVLVRCDPLSRIFGVVFSVAALAANLYGWQRERCSEQVAALIYAGGGLAVVFAGDLLSVLIAWEIMAVASALLVFAAANPRASAAGQRYLLVHLAAGSLMLLGVVGMLSRGDSIAFEHFATLDWPALAILLSLCMNAAVPPLHGWLPDAYPESTVSGSVFLSTFTTKAAVYCLVRGFAGTEALVWLGAVMATYGVVFATMEDNMRRLLSYHIVSQVGYMVCGIGVGTALALNGTVAHAVCHILYKALLFMAVGAVVSGTGRERLSELGGLYRAMPRTFLFYMVGALSISGAPLFNGFVSKSLVISGAAEAHYTLAVFLLSLASVGTFLSVGLKLPYFAFSAKPASGPAGEPDMPRTLAMAGLAAMCLAIGLFPGALYAWLPQQPVHYHPYSAYHVFEMLGVMAFCGWAFWQLRGRLQPHRGNTLDLDQLYRLPSRWLAEGVSVTLDRTADTWAGGFSAVRERGLEWVRDPTRPPQWRGGERQLFDENRARPPVARPVGWLAAALVLLVSLLLIAG